MQITLSDINTKEFFTRPCVIAGVPCVLVEPHGVGVVKWDRHNLIYRSSLWTMDGEPVSLSLKKFHNWDEDIDKDGNHIPDKIPYPKPKDGSLLLISRFRNELIVRTRGTIDAETTLSNGHEIPYLKTKYAKLFQHAMETEGITYCAEWTTPTQKIVLDYGDEPSLTLIGAIKH